MSKRFSAIFMPLAFDRRSVPDGIWSKFRRLIRADDGVSAIEFALLASMLVPALTGTVDIGLALTERMAIDQVLRAGAQSAMAGGNAMEIEQVMWSTAGDNYPKVSCAIADQSGTVVPTTCAEAESVPPPPQVFYDLTGEKTYTGIFFDYPLSSALRVQVR